MPRVKRNGEDAAGANQPELRRGIDTGQHYSLAKGALVIGPDWKAFIASLFLVGAPSGVFMGFVAPWLGRHLSWGLFVVSILLIVVSLASLVRTALRDPGFLPRNHLEEDEEYGYGQRNPTKEFQVNGFTVTTKWCSTCNHYRPPRCSHCAVCDNCVEKFDHHCPWVGTCIGRRNYRWFLTFVFTTTLLCVWVFALSLVQLLKYAGDSNQSFGRAISKYPASMVTMIYTFLAFWFVGGLSAFHLFLSGTNQTTYEHFRHRYSDAGNPYNIGILRNLGSVWCTRVPKRSELPHLAIKAPESGGLGPHDQEAFADAGQPWQQQQQTMGFGDTTRSPPAGGVLAALGQNGSASVDPAHLEAAHHSEKMPPAPMQLQQGQQQPVEQQQGMAVPNSLVANGENNLRGSRSSLSDSDQPAPHTEGDLFSPASATQTPRPDHDVLSPSSATTTPHGPSRLVQQAAAAAAAAPEVGPAAPPASQLVQSDGADAVPGSQ